MITKLAIENYGPINHNLEIDFFASSKSEEFPKFEIRNKKVSKINGFFGKNGSGKTAIIDAISIIQKIVLDNHKNHRHFRERDIYKKALVHWPNVHSDLELTTIKIELYHKKEIFSYEVKVKRGLISYEILKVKSIKPNSKWKTILKRKDDKLNKKIISLSISAINEKLLEKKSNKRELNAFKEAINKIYILKSNNKLTADIASLINDLKHQINSNLVLGFSNFDDYKKKVIDNLFKSIDSGIAKIDFTPRRKEKYLIEEDQIEIYTFNKLKPKIQSSNEYVSNRNIKLSVGTYSFIALMLASLKVSNEGGVLIVDEFGTQFHPEISNLVFDIFANQDSTNSNQLIFNTNQISLIENLERSEMQFLDNNGYGTNVRKLKRKEFHNRNIYKNFRIGAFYGAPLLDLESISKALEKN